MDYYAAKLDYPSYPLLNTWDNNNYDGILTRKPPHAYGWDIMPRVVTSGLWKDVDLVKNTVFVYQSRVHTSQGIIEKAPKTQAGKRIITIGQDVVDALGHTPSEAVKENISASVAPHGVMVYKIKSK